MKKLPKCTEPKDVDEWQAEIADVKAMPSVEERPQSPLVIDEIKPSVSGKGLYNHNSFNELQIGDMANIDRNLAEKLVAGKLKIEGRLDLHGLSEKQAFDKVREFIVDSYVAGKRCVLIITGKGLSKEVWWESKGIIRQSFAQWLNNIEIRPYLLAATQATSRDGGTGAFYCLLKRQR